MNAETSSSRPDPLPWLHLKAPPFDEASVDALSADSIPELCALDAAGAIVGANESLAEFQSRLRSTLSDLRSIDAELASHGRFDAGFGLCPDSGGLMSPESLAEASEDTWSAYRFRLSWAPGFYVSGLGLLWGGCALSFDGGLSVFFVRKEFASRGRWLWYSRRELLSHETCHAARSPLADPPCEELFAYALSSSPLRRYLGNCFQSRWDSILILGPILILLAAQSAKTFLLPSLPAWPFWTLAALYPAWIGVRNHLRRGIHRSARRNLGSAVESGLADAVLFRCVSAEMAELARLPGPDAVRAWIDAKAASSLRWSVIRARFVRTPDEPGRRLEF